MVELVTPDLKSAVRNAGSIPASVPGLGTIKRCLADICKIFILMTGNPPEVPQPSLRKISYRHPLIHCWNNQKRAAESRSRKRQGENASTLLHVSMLMAARCLPVRLDVEYFSHAYRRKWSPGETPDGTYLECDIPQSCLQI